MKRFLSLGVSLTLSASLFNIAWSDARPAYTREQVSRHTTKEKRIWVTWKNGVYDITEFVDVHPGGEKILLAAGQAIDPFWAIFSVHSSKETQELLEYYRIGDLKENSPPPSNPGLEKLFENEPKRHPSLVTRSARPCNAESPLTAFDDWITPNSLFFVRNHLPVPVVEDYSLHVSGPGFEKTYTLQELKKLPVVNVTATLQCAGNRRAEMHKVKPVNGLLWEQGAISNAEWKGVRLADVLHSVGLKATYATCRESPLKHVQSLGAEGYGASIPLEKALDPNGDVILAYEMNGEPIPRDHGYPVRAIVPGVVAARSVKWVTEITVSEDESPSHWQQKDYKGFSPSATLQTMDYSKSESIQELPVQSAIFSPRPGHVEYDDDGNVIVKGYAYSGGGKRILRVDVSQDGGKTWQDAELKPSKSKWSWTLWTTKVKSTDQLVCKAVDSQYNSQPESFESIYNVRGVLVNAWHRLTRS